MFAYFKGVLSEKTPTYAVVECHGVGYLLHISLHTYSQLPDPQPEAPVQVLLYALHIVREDSQLLFGFSHPGERELFSQLITVSGVGANTARMILSAMDPQRAVEAIVTGNATALSRIKGIGAKTASRIILDLKDKVGRVGSTSPISAGAHNTAREAALSSMLMLGFVRAAAEKALDRVIREEGAGLELEKLIKAALKLL